MTLKDLYKKNIDWDFTKTNPVGRNESHPDKHFPGDHPEHNLPTTPTGRNESHPSEHWPLDHPEHNIPTEVDGRHTTSDFSGDGSATSPEGRHYDGKFGPDYTYSTHPGWISGDFHFQNNLAMHVYAISFSMLIYLNYY